MFKKIIFFTILSLALCVKDSYLYGIDTEYTKYTKQRIYNAQQAYQAFEQWCISFEQVSPNDQKAFLKKNYKMKKV